MKNKSISRRRQIYASALPRSMELHFLDHVSPTCLVSILLVSTSFLLAVKCMLKISWTKILDSLYDIGICSFSMLDIVCDILVTLDFYQHDHTVFFWISIMIFVLAQISYAVILTWSLEPTNPNLTSTERATKYGMVFMVCVPFGQLIPLFLMVQDAHLDTFNNFYQKFGYRSVFKEIHERHLDKKDEQEDVKQRPNRPAGPSRPSLRRPGRHASRRKVKQVATAASSSNSVWDDAWEDVVEQVNVSEAPEVPEEDPLSDYIKQKTISHLGFIIEAVVEAVPQSILQMVFVVIHGHYTTLNVVSILMSMTVVASKGTLLCYNIYRPTAIFNFLAFAVDIFGIFSVCAWLFCLTDVTTDSTDYILFEMFPVWAPAYYYFRSLTYVFYLLLMEAFVGLGMLVHEMYRKDAEHPWKSAPAMLLIVCGACLVIMPATLVVLTVRFTLVPMLVLQSFDHTRKKSLRFFTILFDFFGQSPGIGDLHERILLANWRLAKTADYVFNHEQSRLQSNEYNYHAQRKKQLVMDWRHQTFKPIADMREERMSLSAIYQIVGWKGLMRYHQIREIIEFLYKLKIWNIMWKSMIASMQLKENKNKNGKKPRNELDMLAMDEDEDENSSQALTRDEKEKRDQLRSSWTQIKTIISWEDIKNKLKDKWQYIKSYDYKRLFRELWDELKRNARWSWENRWEPRLVEFWNETLPKNSWILISRFWFAILQDCINFYLNFRKALIWVLYKCGLGCFESIKIGYFEPRYEIILLDWRVPHVWWYWKGVDLNKWNQRSKNLINRNIYRFVTEQPQNGAYFPPIYEEQPFFPAPGDVVKAARNNIKLAERGKRVKTPVGKLGSNNPSVRLGWQENASDMNANDEKLAYWRRAYVLEGLYTYFACVIYYLVHAPLRDMWRSNFWTDLWPGIAVFLFGIGIVPCVLFLAVYSLFLPMIFMMISLYHYGLYSNPHQLQLVLTTIHSIVVVCMFSLIPYVWRFVYSDFHLYPYFNEEQTIDAKYAQHIVNIHDATPLRNELILDSVLGPDIGRELIKFLPKWHIYNDEVNIPHVKDVDKEEKQDDKENDTIS